MKPSVYHRSPAFATATARRVERSVGERRHADGFEEPALDARVRLVQLGREGTARRVGDDARRSLTGRRLVAIGAIIRRRRTA
jgi:hypothetical protein